MPSLPVDPALIEWYARSYDESARLDRSGHGRLELVRTRELIGAHLREEPMRVLDVGGGAGVHARWLAGLGHRVHVVDPVPRHVAAAAALPGVTAHQGDARALADPDEAYDLVLVLGPLYHLLDRDDRVSALREAARVAAPGAPVLAAAVGRYHVLGEFALTGDLDERCVDVLGRLVRTGENTDRTGFTLRHAHTWDELRDEGLEAGLRQVEVVGVEGPIGYGIDLLPSDRLDAAVEQSAQVARMVQSDPRAVDLSPHLLLVGQAP